MNTPADGRGGFIRVPVSMRFQIVSAQPIGKRDGEIDALADLARCVLVLVVPLAHPFERIEQLVEVSTNSCWRNAGSLRARASSSSMVRSLMGRTLPDSR